MESKANVGAYCTVSAIVYRADGRVEDLGVICGGEMKPQNNTTTRLTIIQRIRRIFKNGRRCISHRSRD